MRFLLHFAVNALALAVATWFVPGIKAGGLGSVLAAALVFGLVNALVRPFLKLLSCPLIILTLGLFTLVLNALMLQLTAWISNQGLGIQFSVDTFWHAFLGALLMAVVSMLLSLVLFPVKQGA